MKTKFLFITLLASGVLLNVSCSKESTAFIEEEDLNLKTASLTLTVSIDNGNEIVASNVETRALGNPTQADESKIFNYSVYVFYPNGSLEKAETISGSTLTHTITGLTAGTKRVVVLANVPAGYATINHYDDIEDEMFLLDTQEPAVLSSTGLAMSGETTTILNPGSANTLSLSISRIVAKIKLGGITVNAAAGHDPSKLNFVAIHIMKARANANMGIPAIKTGNAFYGGVTGTVSTIAKSYLTDSITTGNENCYFYVFPNDSTSGNATLLSIEATYDNVKTYFTFSINDKVVAPGDGTGEYIKRNTVHTVNVTLKKLDGGSTDPEQPADPADLDVTIVPENWVDIPAQAVEW